MLQSATVGVRLTPQAAAGELAGDAADAPRNAISSAASQDASGNKTAATAAPPGEDPSAAHPAGKPSTSNEHAGTAPGQ